MAKVKQLLLLLSPFSLAIFPAGSPGNVTLSLADFDATPNSTTVAKGGSFTVGLTLSTTGGEKTTGLDYLLQSSTSNIFTITSRDRTNSQYPDPVTPDATVAGQGLNPRGASELGASETNVNVPTSGPGPFQVANYTISVSPSAPAATYTISTTESNAGNGWIGAGPNFTELPFNTQGAFTVTVTPEPSALGLLGLGGAAALRRRRR